MEKQPSKKEIPDEIKKLRDENGADQAELQKIQQEREKLEAGEEPEQPEKIKQQKGVGGVEKKLSSKGEKNKTPEETPEAESGKEPKTEKQVSRIDTQKVVEEINKIIEEQEREEGVKFTDEQKVVISQSVYLRAQEDFQAKKIESSGKIKNALLKTAEWWKGVDKKEVGKAAGKALILSGFTIGLGLTLGITPTNVGSIAYRMGWSGLSATGINMGVSTPFAKKFLGKKGDENKSWWKKELNFGNGAAALGIGVSAALSGGLAVPLIGAAGYAYRRWFINGLFDKKIKGFEHENTEESLAKAKNWKFAKSVLGGAGIIAAGLSTMAAYHHNNLLKFEDIFKKGKGGIDHEEIKTGENSKTESKTEPKIENETKPSTNGPKNAEEIKPKVALKSPEELKKEIEEQFRTKDATVHKGEGIEHSFIRQIEHNPELAKELAEKTGFKGDLSNQKILHEFAGREAHIIAMKEGYVDNAGHEVRITEADKVAYEIKLEKDGHITVNEETLVDGKIKVVETHHEGDKFEGEKTEKKYERVYPENIKQATAEHASPANNEYEGAGKHVDNDLIMKEPTDSNAETNTGKQRIDEYEDNSLKEKTVSGQEDISTAEKNAYEAGVYREDSPFNPHIFSSEEYNKLNDIYEHNLKVVSLNDPKTFEHIKLSADEIVNTDIDTVNDLYKAPMSYIQELKDITGIHPMARTALEPAETAPEFVARALQLSALHDGYIPKAWVDADEITHLEKINIEK